MYTAIVCQKSSFLRLDRLLNCTLSQNLREEGDISSSITMINNRLHLLDLLCHMVTVGNSCLPPFAFCVTLFESQMITDINLSNIDVSSLADPLNCSI